LYAHSGAGVTKTTVRHGDPVAARKDSLPGAGELLPDGRVRYVVAVGELCQAPKIIEERRESKPSLTGGGIAYFTGASLVMAAGIGLIAHGVLLREEELGSDNTGRAVEAGIGVGAAVIGAVLLGLGARRGAKQKRALGPGPSTPVKTRTEGMEDAPCKDPAATIGDLELVTPWNTKSSAKPDANGAVTFDVVWVGDALDPDAPTAESLIAAPWKVSATNAKLQTTWQPLGPQLPQALDIARAAKKKQKAE
jgi:hypothetical protein